MIRTTPAPRFTVDHDAYGYVIGQLGRAIERRPDPELPLVPVYCVARSVSRSGASSVWSFYFVGDRGELVCLDALLAAIGVGTRKRDRSGITIPDPGCRVEFHVVRALTNAIGADSADLVDRTI